MLRNALDVIVIGAGPAGLFAARRLAKMGKRVTVLEKEAQVGGKCFTYSDKDQPEVKTEWGAALIAPNYGVVLDAIQEKGVQLEESLNTAAEGMSILDHVRSLSWWQTISFSASFAIQLCKFTYATSCYQYARDHEESLPPDYELPFARYAEKYNLQDINIFLKSFVTAFGYGLMDECPTYAVMEYMGLTTIPAVLASPITPGLVSIKNGFQTLMQRVAEDFPVATSAQVTSISRTPKQVTVTYQQDQQSKSITADALVLAVSPQHWRELGMPLTQVEEACVQQLSSYRYPVAVCKVDGAAAEHHYMPQGLERNGLGKLALFTTRDQRANQPRLGTAYVNLPHDDHEYQFTEQQIQTLQAELKTELHAQQAEIIEHKIWEDYMPTLPWQQRLALEKSQDAPNTNTVYTGAYTLGGFEDVACVAEQATKAVDKYLLNRSSHALNYYKNEANRALFFYTQPRLQAASDSIQENKLKR